MGAANVSLTSKEAREVRMARDFISKERMLFKSYVFDLLCMDVCMYVCTYVRMYLNNPEEVDLS